MPRPQLKHKLLVLSPCRTLTTISLPTTPHYCEAREWILPNLLISTPKSRMILDGSAAIQRYGPRDLSCLSWCSNNVNFQNLITSLHSDPHPFPTFQHYQHWTFQIRILHDLDTISRGSWMLCVSSVAQGLSRQVSNRATPSRPMYGSCQYFIRSLEATLSDICSVPLALCGPGEDY